MQNLTSLQELQLSNCPSITSFPEGGLPTSLVSLDIKDWKNLMPMSERGLHRLASLRRLTIHGISSNLSCFPEWLLPSTLETLNIVQLSNLESLSPWLQNFTSLENLKVKDCRNLLSLPKECVPPMLSYLEISGCPLLEQNCDCSLLLDLTEPAHVQHDSDKPAYHLYRALKGMIRTKRSENECLGVKKGLAQFSARTTHSPRSEGKQCYLRQRYDSKICCSSYMSPEYVMGGVFSEKSDVYRTQDKTLPHSFASAPVLRCIRVGLVCIQDNGADWTSTSSVVLMLSSEMDLPRPKQPTFVFHRWLDSESINVLLSWWQKGDN
ncbi:hypothetical protein CQW23_09137 [Capsicum baccatum]|uniref:Uncharacterized protein n=1 Tax=Capsicum baccatum TaxID=33114 RepID=A0A2G2WW27_CAPBA|nr:hypothetical protein CQW23_09137 [Capsicum baccatum]